MKLVIPKGTTSKRIGVFIQDSSSTTGAGLAALAFNSAGLTWYYWREDEGDANATAVTPATATRGTFTSSGFKEKDATNMPGFYELGVPNAALATGAEWVVMILKGATNMAPLTIEIQLSDPVRGLGAPTALPNAAAEAAGGLYTRGTGAGQINQNANGQIDANAVALSGDSAAADNLESALDGGSYNVGGGAVVAASVTGAVGSVTGAVGSVTGAAGSVTGAVGSVTGNVGGNVVGTVASVVGAVGSVTGNVGGNVTGSVGSVVGAVGSVTGNVGGNVTGSVGSVATGGIAAASFAAGAITAASIATDAIDDDALSADAVAAIQSGLSTLTAAGVRTAVGLASANLDTQLGDLPTAIENADAFLDRASAVDGYTPRQSMRLLMAALAGKSSGGAASGASSPVFRAADDSKNRITATISAAGDRTAVTLDAT